MKYKKSRGFSFLELLITVFLFSFVITGSFSFYAYHLKTSKTLVYKGEIESLHNRFQYLLNKNDYCSPSLSAKTHGDNVEIQFYDPDDPTPSTNPAKQRFKDEIYEELFNKAKALVNNPLEKGVGLEKISLDIDPNFFFEDRGYANLIFDYVFKEDHSGIKTQTKKMKVFLSIENNPSGVYSVKNCLNHDEETCTEKANFLTSFNESSLDVSTEYTLKSGDKREEGTEYSYKVSNLFDGQIGEYCVSHNVCSNGQWISKSVCYDSCRDQYWWDGILSYKNKLTDTVKSNEKAVCKRRKFHFNTKCVNQSIKSTTLKERKFNETNGYLEVFKNKTGKKQVGKFEAIFKCSYAGTWVLEYAKCHKIDPVTNKHTETWKISPLNPNNVGRKSLLCPSARKTLNIKSYDKKETQKIDLGRLYNKRYFYIGEPKRLIINFKDKTSTATIACTGSGGSRSWKQIGDSVRNCDVLNNPVPKVDIIFVVDNSGSMGDNQVALSNSADQFISNFFTKTAKRIDYRILVATTDHQLSGSFSKKNYVGKEATLKTDLKTALSPGTGGNASEKPISSTLSVLNSYPPRKGGALALFFITDEDGNNEETKATSDLKQMIDSFTKGDKSKVILNGAINDPTGGTQGKRHVSQVVNYYGGKLFDADNKSGYGKEMSDFSKEIIEKTLIIGN